MGCPDWPKCFGSAIPPSNEASLPDNYREIFLDQRIQKNERLAGTLESLGFEELAVRVRNDQNIFKTDPFNATKAWVEYVNRLIGVLIGLLVILNMFFAFKLRSVDWRIPAFGVIIFILTVFQGWIGSLVVSTNLLPGFITFHMILALLIVVLLIWMRIISEPSDGPSVSKWTKWILGILFLLLIPQVVTGTLTREQVDVILKAGTTRFDLVSELTGSYFLHRSYSWLLLVVALVVFWKLRRAEYSNWAFGILGIVLIEFALGVIMIYGGMPVYVQPVHLLLATILFGMVFYLFLQLKPEKT